MQHLGQKKTQKETTKEKLPSMLHKNNHPNSVQRSMKHSILISSSFQQQVCGKRIQAKHVVILPPEELIQFLPLLGLETS